MAQPRRVLLPRAPIGEIGIVGTAAAITSAIHHATRRRFRRPPVKIEDILAATGEQGYWA